MKNEDSKPSSPKKGDTKDENVQNKKQGHQDKNSKHGSQFKGETPGMQGRVFCLQSKQTKKGEFKDTMEALERYAGRAYPLDTTKLQTLFKNLVKPSFEEPTIPTSKATSKTTGAEGEEPYQPTKWEKIKFVEEYKLYLKSQERLTATLIALFNVVWGQCSRRIQERLKAEEDYEEAYQKSNVAVLLKFIKIVSHKFEANVCLDESLWEAKHKFFT